MGWLNRKTAVCTGIMTGVGEDDPRMLTHGTEVHWEQGSYTQQSSILQMYPNQGIKLARDPDEIYLPKISNVQQIRGESVRAWHSTHQQSWICQTSVMKKRRKQCYSGMQRSSVRTVTGFYTENTSKKDLVRQQWGISIGCTLVVIDINFDQKT